MPAHNGPMTSADLLLKSVAAVEYGGRRYVISPLPTTALVPIWVARLRELEVGLLVRLSEDQSYTAQDLGDIRFVEFPLQDGAVPNSEQVTAWNELAEGFFKCNPGRALAIHCTAGLGRSAVVVAISLMNARLSAEKAIELIRSKRKGALNAKQVAFVLDYKAKRRRKFCCV
uniref:Uncharacterized protein n=1 Tax=Spongospora subterranea TaxID=70186 RepID=A0A0H5RE89_9EUKA|eukprot:CRZ11857.1 hypothetical protein [Spongospora subterranea]